MQNSFLQTRFQSPRISSRLQQAVLSGLAKQKLSPQTVENNQSCLQGNMAR